MLENTINDDKTIAGGSETILAWRYHVLRQLGEGAMGSVWLAEDRHLVQYPLAFWASRRWAWAWRRQEDEKLHERNNNLKQKGKQ